MKSKKQTINNEIYRVVTVSAGFSEGKEERIRQIGKTVKAAESNFLCKMDYETNCQQTREDDGQEKQTEDE